MRRHMAAVVSAVLAIIFLASCASVEVRAVRTGDIAGIADFLNGGGDPNSVNNNGKYLVHIAVEAGQLQSLQFLLQNGALPDVQDRQGATPLHRATSDGRTDMIQALADFNADATIVDFSSQGVLFYAARSGRDNTLDLLFTMGADARQTDNQNRSPLHLLNRNDRRRFAARLLEAGTDVYLRESGSGETALHVAARSGAFDLVDLYILSGGQGLVPIEDSRGARALFSALNPGVPANAGFRTLQILLENDADPNQPGPNRELPIQAAVARLDAQRVELLLSYGADSNVPGSGGASLLHESVQKNDSEMTRILLAAGADPNAEDNRGRSPMFAAAILDSDEIFRQLVVAGGNINLRDNNGTTALTLSLEKSASLPRGLTRQAELMLGRNGVISGTAEQLYRIVLITIESQNTDVASLLLPNAVNPEQRDSNGRTLLSIAAAAQKPLMVNYLLRLNVMVDARDQSQNTALILASGLQSLDIVRSLITAGANALLENAEGFGPIHFASRSGNPESLRLILLAGANPNAPTLSGARPYEIAQSHPQRETVQEILELAGAVVPEVVEPVEVPQVVESPGVPQSDPPASTDSADGDSNTDSTTDDDAVAVVDDADNDDDDDDDDDRGILFAPRVASSNEIPFLTGVRRRSMKNDSNLPRNRSEGRISFEGYATSISQRYPSGWADRGQTRAVQLYIENASGFTVEIFYLDDNSEPKPIARLEDGEDILIDTREGVRHPIFDVEGGFFGAPTANRDELQWYFLDDK